MWRRPKRKAREGDRYETPAEHHDGVRKAESEDEGGSEAINDAIMNDE
jgi:hypothetical protein